MADMISRNSGAPRMQQKSTKTKSAKKTPRRPVTPGKSKAKSGKELWMTAVKKRQALTLSNTYRSASPRHMTPTEYFVDTLRKTGVGISSETNKNQSMTGLRGNSPVYPYLSTSHYMRQVMGAEKTSRNMDDPTVRANAGTPAYKTPEEYYDEVLALRKQIAALNHESATSKTKIRRLEEDNQKKEREIEGLLNPGQNGELRRTLGDRQADSGAVIHSLKQKILKLEMQLRDKESAYNKLQADLKTTKVDEMRVQLEAVYAEVMRLQLSRDTGVEKSRGGSESTAKVKALSETVIRLSRSNEQLQAENKSLKDDLNRALEASEAKVDTSKEYADMNRKELLATISRLEKKLERADVDSLSAFSQDGPRRTQGKVELQGSLEDRLHQLDQRETELLDEVEKWKAVVRRNRDERKRADDSSSLPPTPRRRQSRAVEEGLGSRPVSGRKSSRPGTAASQEGRVENFKQKHAATNIQRQWRQRKQRKIDDEVEMFRENRAARKIQHGWLDYKHRHYDEDLDDAAFTIQEAMRGYHSRHHQMQNWRTDGYESSVDTDDGVVLIQSSLKGHRNRQSQLRKWRNQYTDDDEDSVLSGSFGRRRVSSPNGRPLSAQRQMSGSRSSLTGRPASGGRPSSGQRPSSAHRPSSASLYSKRGSTSQTFKARYDVPSPSHQDDDDDDDIVF